MKGIIDEVALKVRPGGSAAPKYSGFYPKKEIYPSPFWLPKKTLDEAETKLGVKALETVNRAVRKARKR